MFRRLKTYMHLFKSTKSGQRPALRESADTGTAKYVIDCKLESNLACLKDLMTGSDDVLYREFRLGDDGRTKALICWIDGLANREKIDRGIIKPLTSNFSIMDHSENPYTGNLLKLSVEQMIQMSGIKEACSMDEVLGCILSGQTALFIDGCPTALIMGTEGWEGRAITEPNTETVIRGPREGFTETLRTNTSLIRRKIKNPNLVFKTFVLGTQTRTLVCIGYIEGVANPDVVEEVRQRLNRIETDAILESGYIEQYIEDHPFSLFSTIGNSEKPDVVVAKMLEGRVAVLCDGTPFVLTVPRLFIENFQIGEDYYTRPFIATFLRMLRLLSFCISLLTPALYVAIETYHQEMIPTVLLVSMAASHEGIPFPAALEAIMMVVIFELIRESGIRLPRAVGQAVSIVGALVIGQAAVEAGLVSAPMVIVVAITGITSFIISPLYDFVVLGRLMLIFFGSILGLYGISACMIVMIAHLCSLRSFGTPFLTPLTPVVWKDLKDTFIRVPLWMMKSRPVSVQPENAIRHVSPAIPAPPGTRNEGEDRL